MPHPLATPHKIQYERHFETGETLERDGTEWAAVCYFYAAYRAVRCALYNDVRLNSDANARAANPKLTASSRHVDHHQGHPSRGPGINDIVRYLYPSIATQYRLLHEKSVEVRYLDGLVGVSIEDTRALADAVIAELTSKGLLP